MSQCMRCYYTALQSDAEHLMVTHHSWSARKRWKVHHKRYTLEIAEREHTCAVPVTKDQADEQAIKNLGAYGDFSR